MLSPVRKRTTAGASTSGEVKAAPGVDVAAGAVDDVGDDAVEEWVAGTAQFGFGHRLLLGGASRPEGDGLVECQALVGGEHLAGGTGEP